MNKIAIVTDTDSSLPVDLANQYGIRQVPITIHFEDSSYTTGIDIDDRLVEDRRHHLGGYESLPDQFIQGQFVLV